MNVGGIILCGGRSSRMGRPKAWLPFGGETMLQRVVRTVGGVVDPVVVVAAPGQQVPPLPSHVQLVRDEHDGCGPLEGLAAGLTALQGRADAAYLSSCDVPLLKADFIRRVIDRLGTASIGVPKVGGHHHPLAAVYRPDVLPELRRRIAIHHLRVASLFDAVPTRVIGPDELADVDPNFQSLRNLNTPDDYDRAIADLP